MMLKALWARITEPRHVKIAMLALYLVATITGVVTLIMPPRTIEAVIGGVTYLWSALVLFGGGFGAFSVLPGWWWLERRAIILIWAGLGIYAIVLLYLHFSQPGTRLTQLGVVILAAGGFYLRYAGIWRYSFEPRPDRE